MDAGGLVLSLELSKNLGCVKANEREHEFGHCQFALTAAGEE